MGGLFKYAREYLWQSLVCPLLMVVEVVMDLLLPYRMADIIDVGIAGGDRRFAVFTGLKMVLMAAVALASGALAARLSSVASMGFGANLRGAMYANIQTFAFSNIDRFSTASLVTRMTTDVTQIQMMYMMLLRIFIRAPMMFAVASFLCFKINPVITSVLLAALPIIVLFLVIFGPIALRLFKKMFRMFDRLNASVQENLISIRVVKAFVRGEFEKEKFKASNDALMRASINAARLMVMAQPLLMLLMYGTILTVTYLSSKFILNGQMGIGKLTAVITYIIQILMSAVMIAMIFVQFIISRAAAGRIGEVLAEKADIRDEGADRELKVESGSVEFRDVSFKYETDGKRNVVDHVSFSAAAGETVGIIGGTGSAKTSLVSLIPRLYDVTGGEVLVGGRDVRDYTLRELREAVGMVLQKNVLFSGTISENLRWGDPNASQEELEEACRAAQAHDFILSFPDGYETDLGQGGVNVSGGQKQRLCIARALLKKPKILILDDSTSAVDTLTDAKLREALRTRLPDTTKLIIAQRLSSVEDADKIIVLDDGRISDVGTHSELMERSEIYREVYLSQQKGTVLAEGGGA